MCWKRRWKCPDEPRYGGSKTKGDILQYLLGMRQEITCYAKHPQPQLPIQTGFDTKYHLPNQCPLAGSSYWALLCALPQPPQLRGDSKPGRGSRPSCVTWPPCDQKHSFCASLPITNAFYNVGRAKSCHKNKAAEIRSSLFGLQMAPARR